jgi:hypothetical protein
VPSYKVKSQIQGGPSTAPKKTAKTYGPGDSIELTEDEAIDVGHALEDPPDEGRRGDPSDQLPPEVLASIKGNPEHPLSGIEMYWKTRADLSVRPEENKSNLEIALEPERAAGEAESKAATAKKGQPGLPVRPTAPRPDQGLPGQGRPVVPPVTRPEPKK